MFNSEYEEFHHASLGVESSVETANKTSSVNSEVGFHKKDCFDFGRVICCGGKKTSSPIVEGRAYFQYRSSNFDNGLSWGCANFLVISPLSGQVFACAFHVPGPAHGANISPW